MLDVGAQAQVIEQHASVAAQHSHRGRHVFAIPHNQCDCKAAKRMQVLRAAAGADAAMVLVPGVAAVEYMVYAFYGPVTPVL